MTVKTRASRPKAPTRTQATPKRRTADRGSRSVGSPNSPTKTNTTGIRTGSKQALLLELLGQPAGTRIADLTEELNWLPHTVRAALTRLRQQGYGVTRSKSGEGDTVYHATPPVAAKKRSRVTTKTAA